MAKSTTSTTRGRGGAVAPRGRGGAAATQPKRLNATQMTQAHDAGDSNYCKCPTCHTVYRREPGHRHIHDHSVCAIAQQIRPALILKLPELAHIDIDVLKLANETRLRGTDLNESHLAHAFVVHQATTTLQCTLASLVRDGELKEVIIAKLQIIVDNINRTRTIAMFAMKFFQLAEFERLTHSSICAVLSLGVDSRTRCGLHNRELRHAHAQHAARPRLEVVEEHEQGGCLLPHVLRSTHCSRPPSGRRRATSPTSVAPSNRSLATQIASNEFTHVLTNAWPMFTFGATKAIAVAALLLAPLVPKAFFTTKIIKHVVSWLVDTRLLDDTALDTPRLPYDDKITLSDYMVQHKYVGAEDADADARRALALLHAALERGCFRTRGSDIEHAAGRRVAILPMLRALNRALCDLQTHFRITEQGGNVDGLKPVFVDRLARVVYVFTTDILPPLYIVEWAYTDMRTLTESDMRTLTESDTRCSNQEALIAKLRRENRVDELAAAVDKLSEYMAVHDDLVQQSAVHDKIRDCEIAVWTNQQELALRSQAVQGLEVQRAKVCEQLAVWRASKAEAMVPKAMRVEIDVIVEDLEREWCREHNEPVTDEQRDAWRKDVMQMARFKSMQMLATREHDVKLEALERERVEVERELAQARAELPKRRDALSVTRDRLDVETEKLRKELSSTSWLQRLRQPKRKVVELQPTGAIAQNFVFIPSQVLNDILFDLREHIDGFASVEFKHQLPADAWMALFKLPAPSTSAGSCTFLQLAHSVFYRDPMGDSTWMSWRSRRSARPRRRPHRSARYARVHSLDQRVPQQPYVP